MYWYQVFQDGPEYEARKKKGTFTPPNLSMKDLHDAVPRHLFQRSTTKSICYVLRHLMITYVFYLSATGIDDLTVLIGNHSHNMIRTIVRSALWISYWGWQGIMFAGIWCLAHEAGHDALSPYRFVNTALGIFLHTAVLTPYFAWRATHHTHHKSTNNIERDETYIPPTRKDFKLPDGKVAVRMDYAEVLEETPAFTLFKLAVRQFLGFQLYLIHNRKGNPRYPAGTSHYKPSSLLFKPKHRPSIILSNIAIITMILILGTYGYRCGWSSLWAYYIMPWLFAHNWMVMFTYLQHSDPTIPYYRKDQWTFARGALATVDRPLFGWVGRFFLYGISADHVAHHFFVSIPFYNLPEVTEAIKPVLGECYNYDSTPVLYALWRSFTQCTFVEDEGGVLFFKNQYGEAVMQPLTLGL
ncbi:fatty acid desaturase-domain-containing protein [Crucibulum laeve]|uniref:Fatty acid desaturase-domain-containing protein n=1 Tax=Crucibulum laeve TaxID=68775 RepID=A0A5C3LEH2_9AGAR|nr:fatty acid desaturase-domain-containing protein [Crucibulum laeve]